MTSRFSVNKKIEELTNLINMVVQAATQSFAQMEKNDKMLASAVDEQDITLAAIMQLLMRSGHISTKEFEEKRAEIRNLKDRIRQQQQEEASKSTQIAEDLAAKAEEAVKVGPYPKGAFIFGGD